MIILYWSVGKIIKTEILKDEGAEYGKSIIKELISNYAKGYSQANLFNMAKLYDTVNDFEILQTLSVKLSWSHLLKLITIYDPLKREFYIVYERTAISKKPEETILRHDKKNNKSVFLHFSN